MARRNSWRKVNWFVKRKPKRRKLPEQLLELRKLKQELEKHGRYTAIRKGSDGVYFLEPVPPPAKHDAMFKATRTGHVQN